MRLCVRNKYASLSAVNMTLHAFAAVNGTDGRTVGRPTVSWTGRVTIWSTPLFSGLYEMVHDGDDDGGGVDADCIPRHSG